MELANELRMRQNTARPRGRGREHSRFLVLAAVSRRESVRDGKEDGREGAPAVVQERDAGLQGRGNHKHDHLVP